MTEPKVRCLIIYAMQSKTSSGFTLIELSIVLVIIGLLVGGVLVGRDLILAAEIRNTVGQYLKFQSAVNTFQSKFGGIPGDITATQALAFGFAPTARTDYLYNGNGNQYLRHGNGLVEDASNVSYGTNIRTAADLGSETVLFWQDLSSANLIDGGFSSVTTDTFPGDSGSLTAATIGLFVPAASISGAYWDISALPDANYFAIVRIKSTAANDDVNVAASLSPLQAYDIDIKIDDGVPDTGIVRSSDPSSNSSYAMWSVMTGTACATISPPSSTYTVTSNALTCNLILKAGF